MSDVPDMKTILFIDAYDSFSNNIISLLESTLDAIVTVIKIDSPISNFSLFIKPFRAIVAGPGPGNPGNTNDVGLIHKLWDLDDEDLVPVLGICLGFQSLVHKFGGEVKPLAQPTHGITTTLRSCGDSIFRDVEKCDSVQYHSLHASLGHDLYNPEPNEEVECGIWEPTLTCPELKPLAWVFSYHNNGFLGENPKAVLMAVRHVTKPFYGIQFHPESVCSSDDAKDVIVNWWKEAMAWWDDYPSNRCAERSKNVTLAKIRSGKDPLKQSIEYGDCEWTDLNQERRQRARPLPTPPATPRRPRKVTTCTIPLNTWKIPEICHRLNLTAAELVVLDSEMYQRHDIGEYTIIGLVSPDSLRIEYHIATNRIVQKTNEEACLISLEPYRCSVFEYLKEFMAENETLGHPQIPFWGGMVGYITYEACLETVGVPSAKSVNEIMMPDLSFIFVERSIVVSHQENTLHIQSIRPNDDGWVTDTAKLLRSSNTLVSLKQIHGLRSSIRYPDQLAYKAAIRSSQSSIRAGDAYELCLTSQTHIKTSPPDLPSWPLYLELRKLNPAPFSAYMRLGALTFLSSSPERFLQWSRPQRSSSDMLKKAIHCQFRPIKGTVKKYRGQGLPDVSLEEATKILATEKERAENLMIVDLIRHDLHGVVGSGRVSVPKLMVVEEYETVFQLVTVVEGELPVDDVQPGNPCLPDAMQDQKCASSTGDRRDDEFPDRLSSDTKGSPGAERTKNSTHSAQRRCKSGIDILAASLPPGSMTGAPKRRACHLLQSLENHEPRGVYSGVVGYLDVGGGGDFSVVIRSAVRWDKSTKSNPSSKDSSTVDEDTQEPKSVGAEHGNKEVDDGAPKWTVGAGGAITSLSTEEGEWEEMMTKLKSTLRLFEGSSSS